LHRAVLLAIAQVSYLRHFKHFYDDDDDDGGGGGGGKCFKCCSVYMLHGYYINKSFPCTPTAGPICMKFSGKVWSDHGTT